MLPLSEEPPPSRAELAAFTQSLWHGLVRTSPDCVLAFVYPVPGRQDRNPLTLEHACLFVFNGSFTLTLHMAHPGIQGL